MKLPTSSSANAIISVTGLSRRFGSKQALDNVTLHVPRGCVFGLMGENGAGKTTLIKHLLGLLMAETGSVRIFGKDPVAEPVGVLSRVGYLSEYRDLPGWMNPARGWIRWSAATSWKRSSAPLLTKDAPCSSPRTCSMKSSVSPINWP
jgi:ABC-type uncharacterized transport system ATPase subunit